MVCLEQVYRVPKSIANYVAMIVGVF